MHKLKVSSPSKLITLVVLTSVHKFFDTPQEVQLNFHTLEHGLNLMTSFLNIENGKEKCNFRVETRGKHQRYQVIKVYITSNETLTSRMS